MRRILVPFLLVLASLPVLGRTQPTEVHVGYGEADSSWHVGTGSGQYTPGVDEGFLEDPAGQLAYINLTHAVTGGEIDPFNHSWKQEHSYGVQSRLSYRTILIEGTNGERAAFVKSDLYLASDALTRRAIQLLDPSIGIGYGNVMFMATHNHSSPYYASPSWGVWLVQDIFDLRTFEYEARRMALSIERAAEDMRPARMGATKIRHTIYKGNIAGATIGDDGTPAGYPNTHADFDISVVRFDEIPSGAPIAVLVNHGQHPESNDGYSLISADYLAPVQRMVDRDIGAKVVWSQGDVGSAEGPYFRDNFEVLPDGVVRAWAHVGHAQTERGARYLADDIIRAYDAIGRGEAVVPFTSDFPVLPGNAFVPGPASHPYPSVSNCRTEPTVEGDPGMVVTGVPDCDRFLDTGSSNENWDQLKASGVPLPENYDAPSFGGVQENMRIHLQAFRLGEVVLASCACEAQMDLILNFESRADSVAGNLNNGYDYPCDDNGDGTWTCMAGSRNQSPVVVTDATYRRMRAQVNNDAAGWDSPENALAANAEPADPAQILGNFTHEELAPEHGYALPIGVGHAGDYNGYVVSYREYMIRDHYRKALTAWGPHTADYMVTRMVRLAGSLKGGPAMAPELLEPLAAADEVRETAFTTALGALTSSVYDAWVAALPDDVGPAGGLVQPENITRFDAATFTWRGGSNAVDNPNARVERLVDGVWQPFADMSGEVQTMVRFPDGLQGLLETYSGSHEWQWTANFEAFDAFPRTVVPGGQTPLGTYRFVVDGVSRSGGQDAPYHIESNAFTVSPWTGITVSDARREADGSVSFVVDPIAYPRTYESQFRHIADDGNAVLCKTCSFRPWASTATVASAIVHVVRSNGTTSDVAATFSGGRWVAATALGPGDVATIEPGGIADSYGETNGTQTTF